MESRSRIEPLYYPQVVQREDEEAQWYEYSTKRYLPAEFCMESSMHGLRYIGQPRRHIIEKIFWVISFLVAVTIAIIFISQIWEKYNKTPVITVFQPKETTIDLIPFPGVTICSTNNVLKEKAMELISRVEANIDDIDSNNDLYLLDHLCQTSTTFTELFNFSLDYGGLGKDLREHLQQFRENMTTPWEAKRNITEMLQHVAQKCSDMIVLCVWQEVVWNCSDLFDEVETDFGYCCAFNMIPQSLLLTLRNDSRDKEYNVKEWAEANLDTEKLILDESQYDTQSPSNSEKTRFPYRQNRPGKSGGLSLLLDPDMDSYFCTNTDSAGFLALAHLPLDFPRVADEGVAIRPNSETYLKIRPELIVSDDDIRGFPLEKRNCYYGNEYSLKYYTIYTASNCENECIANITFDQCGCIRYFMPRDEKQEICGIDKFNCSEKVRKELLRDGLEKRCKVCLPSCTDIEYQMTSSSLPLRQDIPLWEHPNGTRAYWNDRNVSILHVHLSVDSTYPKLRKELFGFVDLLSNTGGLLGLCLGFSALSVLEIFYFITLRCYCKTRRGRMLGQKINKKILYWWGTMLENFYSKNTPIDQDKANMPYAGNLFQIIEHPVKHDNDGFKFMRNNELKASPLRKNSTNFLW